MKPRKSYLLLLLLPLAIIACYKTHSTPPHNIVTDVYLAGTLLISGRYNAVYWKNDSLVILPGGTILSEAYATAVSGNDIYVAGIVEAANNHFVAAYWKNGVLNLLADSSGSSSANGICIQDNDVYICGAGTTTLAYWKNGSMVALPSKGDASTDGIALSGSDVYVSGYNATNIATYWKNGIAFPLTDTLRFARAGGIAVQGNDVYVSGTLTGFLADTAVYWKNGAQVSLSNQADGLTSNIAGGIAISNNNVYVAGEGILLANSFSSSPMMSMLYWKNGTVGNPNWQGAGSSNMVVGSIAVAGPDVYIAGSFGNLPCYLKDGTLKQLGDTIGYAMGVAISQH